MPSKEGEYRLIVDNGEIYILPLENKSEMNEVHLNISRNGNTRQFYFYSENKMSNELYQKFIFEINVISI